ncbi:MAG: hypothetical protein WCI61_06465 [Chloroflexota bacterium]
MQLNHDALHLDLGEGNLFVHVVAAQDQLTTAKREPFHDPGAAVDGDDDDRDCGKPAQRMTGGGLITQAAPSRPTSKDDDKSKKDDKSKGDDDRSKKELKWTWGF